MWNHVTGHVFLYQQQVSKKKSCWQMEASKSFFRHSQVVACFSSSDRHLEGPFSNLQRLESLGIQ
jgi:hypothetical protein